MSLPATSRRIWRAGFHSACHPAETLRSFLHEPGAERLLRNGDMLLMLEGKLTRLQGYYVDPLTIEKDLRNR
jgi:hypothetical protein